MSDGIKKYMYGDLIKVQIVSLDEAFMQLIEIQNIKNKRDSEIMKKLISFCALISSELKEASSYNTVSYKNPATEKNYTVTAYGDGRVCGNISEYLSDSADKVLQSDRHSDMGGDYTSIVAGRGIDSCVKNYICESMQRDAVFFEKEEKFAFAECLPGGNGLRKAKKIFCSENSFSDGNFRLIEEKPIEYGCHCSKRSVRRSLAALGEEPTGDFEIKCKFCGKTYRFSEL